MGDLGRREKGEQLLSGQTLLDPGDVWDDPAEGYYRGSKYHCSTRGEVWWALPSGLGKVRAIAGHEDIVAEFLKLRPAGGSFRITEDGAVITRDPTTFSPIYVCEYGETLHFEEVNVVGAGAQPLDLWPSFYDGSRYSFKKGRTWWRDPEGISWRETRETLPNEIRDRFFKVKPDGGSLRITENGKVLTLIAPQPLPRNIEDQYNALNNTQKNLIAVKTHAVELLPVYLGEFHGGLTLRPARGLNEPLSPQEETDLMAFLLRYDKEGGDEDPRPFDPLGDVEDQIDEGGKL